VVSGPERLAAIVSTLEQIGLPYLVMGGHAVRYYGIDRNTIDYDLHVSTDRWEQLPDLIAHWTLFANDLPVEGPSWRPTVFRRFQIGRLPDGREEWLEFWKANHLLAPFPDLVGRSETGHYGGRPVYFLGLHDLIRSKETERGSDWQDVALLEEIRDERNLAEAKRTGDFTATLLTLRSRKGFEALIAGGAPPLGAIQKALTMSRDPVTSAYLAPYAPGNVPSDRFAGMIGELICGQVSSTEPGSSRHRALVEAVRRLYKQDAMAADRADKQAALKGR
jgi:hypothetical protein